MKSLRNTAPRVFSLRQSPRYPRALGLGLLALVGGCCRNPLDAPEGASDGSTLMAPGGIMAPSFDGGPLEEPTEAAPEADADANSPKDGGKSDASRRTTGSVPPQLFDAGWGNRGNGF